MEVQIQNNIETNFSQPSKLLSKKLWIIVSISKLHFFNNFWRYLFKNVHKNGLKLHEPVAFKSQEVL